MKHVIVMKEIDTSYPLLSHYDKTEEKKTEKKHIWFDSVLWPAHEITIINHECEGQIVISILRITA